MKIKGIGVAFMACVMAVASAAGCARSKWVGDEVIKPTYNWKNPSINNSVADADFRP